MNNEGSGCSKFLGSAVVAGVIAIIGLALAVYTFYNNNQDTQQELYNQEFQISLQQTEIALANEQNQLLSHQLTLVPQQSNIEEQLLTPIPSGNEDFSLTATAFFIQATQIEATSQAIATRQKGIEATQTAITKYQTPTALPICSSSGNLPPVPEAPPTGCILIVEWWVKPDPTPCGLLITRNDPSIPSDAVGSWWYVYPNRPDQHIKEYQAKDLPCDIQDLR